MSKFVLTAQLQLQAPTNVPQIVSQIQNQLNNVSVNVQVKGSAQANQQIQQITQSTKNATTAADRMGRAFAVSIRRFAAFSIATRAVGLFTSTLADAVQTAIDFERELIKISQVTGRSVSSLRDLTDSVTNLSTNLGVTSQSLLEVTTVLTQAGLSSDDTKIALESLAKAALAPNFDSIQETAEGAIAILAQFKQGVGALEGQLSSIDAVAGAFAVEAGDLIDVIRRSGGVFKASGGSLNELLALFTSVRATTRESAESIGTGLRTIFTRIQRPETIEFLKQFGVELVDLNGKFVGPYEAIRRLSEAISGLGEGDLTFIKIAEELGGFRQIGKVLPLLQQFSTAQAALNVAQNAGNGLTKNAETAQAALAIRIIKVREEFLALVRSMTETPTFQIMANAALSLASALIKIADSIKPLLPLLGAVAAFKAVKGIGGFLGGIGAGLTSGKTFNTGGRVQTFASGGSVPALVSNGEAYVPPTVAKKIGYSTLHQMNHADKNSMTTSKFSEGGISIFKGPGSGTSDSIPTSLPVGSFIIREKATKALGLRSGGKVTKQQFAVGGKASRKVDYEKGVGPSPFASAKSNKLGQEVYALQKSSGLTQFEFDDAKRFADANGYNLQQFKLLLAKRAQDKKNKAGLKTNTTDLLSTLRGEPAQATERQTSLARQLSGPETATQPKALSPEAEKLRVMLGGQQRRFAVGGLATADKIAKARSQSVSPNPNKQKTRSYNDGQKTPIRFSVADGNIGAFFMNPSSANDGLKQFKEQKFDITNNKILSLPGINPKETPRLDSQGRKLPKIAGEQTKYTAKGILEAGSIQAFYPSLSDVKQGSLSNIIETNVKQKLSEAVVDTANFVSNNKLLDIPPIDANDSLMRQTAAQRIQSDTGAIKTTAGYLFEGVIDAITGAKPASSNAVFDFPASSLQGNRGRLGALFGNPSGIARLKQADAKASYSSKIVDGGPGSGSISSKIINSINNGILSGISIKPQRKSLGGVIQKFAIGGIANAPLIDDIDNATNTVLPRPSLAIARLLQAGGGAVDVDRTIKRTIGDKAFGSAKTQPQKTAALQTYFRDDSARLKDVQTAPLTQFGQELQSIIKSGKLDGRKISIVSKSKRVPGVAEYLSKLFGIPMANMIFTAGQSKEPAMEAIRTKGPRVERVKKFFGGIIPQQFAVGGKADPKNTLEQYFTDSAPFNLGLSNSRSLNKDQRTQLASDVRNMRQLRSQAPAQVYSSLSRNAFNKFASDTGLDKNPEIPEGTKFFDRSKYYAQEVAKTVGRSFSLPGFVSTSKEFGKAKMFLDNAPRDDDKWAAMLTINTKKNAQGIDVEQQLSGRKLNVTKQDINPRTGKMETFFMQPPSAEKEVILSPRSRFRVTNAKFVDLMGNKNVWADAQQFATGGLVPGVGNSDTIPATLQEGDFVIRKSSVAKLGVENLASMSGYAAGGNVGKSVPALLTPGEWVVSKDQAQSIGYGSLNRMNKIGKFAQGGIVQRFATGTTSSGVQAPTMVGTGGTGQGQNFVPLNMLTKQAQTLAQAQQAQTQTTQQATQTTQNNTKSVEQNGLSFMAATVGLGAIQAAFASLTPVIDKNSTAFEKVTASILNSVSSLVNTIGIAIIALQQLNIQITAATAKMVAQNAFDFLRGAKSLTEIFNIAKSGIPGIKNFTKSFQSALAGTPRSIPARAVGTAAGRVAQAGNFAGTTINRLTGGTGTFSGFRNVLNNSANSLGQTAKQSLNFGYNMSGSASVKDIGNTASQLSKNLGAGRFSNAVSNISARSGAIAGNIAKSNIGQTVGNAVGVTKQFIGGQLSNSPIANFIGKTTSNAFAGFKGGLAGKAVIGGGSTSIAANAGGFAGQGLNIAGNAISGFTKSIGSSLTKITTGLNAAAGPLLAVQIATSLAAGAINSFFDYQSQANKAIEEGNSKKAAELSIDAAAQESIDSFGATAITAGAAIGSLIPGVGTLVGGVVGAGVALSAKFLPALEKAISGTDYISYGFIEAGKLFGGNTYDSIKSLAIAQAEGVKAQKALNEMSDKVTSAMNDLQNGTISAAQAVASTAAQTEQVNKKVEANKKASEDNEKNNKSGVVGGFLRGTARVATLGLAGYMGLESGAQRNARIDQENKGRSQESTKMQEDLIAKNTPAINAFSADIAAAGGSFQDVLANMNDSTSAAFNPGLYQALIQQGTGPLQKSFENIKKEVERAQKAFNAMNLGMQNVQGAAAAAALGVNNYVAAQQAGNVGLEQSLAVLEASVTSAAQGISDADFGKALNDAESTLRGFGASDKQVDKFKGNISAVNEVQKNQSTIFAGAKDKLAANIRKSNSADERKKAFSETIDEQLKAAGYNEETRKRFKDATGNMSDDQLKKIGQGDFSAFEESINELGKKTMEQVSGPLKAAIEIQKQLNELTKQRIEAERQLMNAQLEASNVRMEAMDIAAKYGGPKVTPEMRAQNVVQQANIQSQGIKGVADLKTGSAAELSNRTQQLSTRQAEISAIRMRAATGDSAAQQQIQGEGGLKLQEEEKKIQDAAKSQIQATRDLIKSKEEELKIIKEKNQLEKSSIDALISGDIEKFFDQQAAVGAQAAVATGDQRLIGQFGMSALGAAAQETKRQQEAGVTELYGQQLSGPGGLTERAYGSAISAAGVQNPLAMAQVAAGSTGAEAGIESDIRDLASTMEPTANIQIEAAQNQLIAAQMQLDAARAKGEEAVTQMQARQMATGGVVYASRGIFVPRGTDTVPAMLTPGEFVVNRAAVQRGNNIQILQAMNKGVSASAPAASSQSGDVAAMATGGIVRYRSGGSTGPESGGVGISADALNSFAAALSQFNTELTKNITTLANTKFQITLSPTNINVNLTGTSFLANLTASIKQDLLKFLGQEISNYSVGNDGKLRKTGSTLGTIT